MFVQLELLGQSLYNITFPPDHAELKRYLLPDEEDDGSSNESGNFVMVNLTLFFCMIYLLMRSAETLENYVLMH